MLQTFKLSIALINIMSLHIYIPRILGSVHKKTVYDAFSRMGIGEVSELDMVYKINENRNAYYFAFIKIKPYNTPQSIRFQTKLTTKQGFRLLYDEEAGQYWEIKNYIPRTDRAINETNRNIDNPPDTTIVVNGYNQENIKPINLSQDSLLPTTLIQTTPGYSPIAPIVSSITTLFNQYVSPFTTQDRLNLVQEYEELEREIYVEISTI